MSSFEDNTLLTTTQRQQGIALTRHPRSLPSDIPELAHGCGGDDKSRDDKPRVCCPGELGGGVSHALPFFLQQHTLETCSRAEVRRCNIISKRLFSVQLLNLASMQVQV